MNIGIVGLGYVGLPLSLQFARSGETVLGLDIDTTKVDAINNGCSYIKHIESSAIQEQLSVKRLSASTDFSRVKELDAVIICVPTPLNKNREPDISYIIKTGEAIAPHIKKGCLVVLESTTYPGTTDEDLRKVLEEGSWTEEPEDSARPPLRTDWGEGKGEVSIRPGAEVSILPQKISQDEVRPPGRKRRAGTDFHLAFSPEREDPGNPASKVAEIPKVVGGFTPACLEKATALYSKAIKKIVPVSSCRAAEATKLLENIFRSVNIALVNELKTIYAAMGIDVWEVINAAKTKPFGYMAFYPGPGLGGHCIPIDPFYLTWKAREYGQNTRFIELAGEINTSMPHYVVSRVAEALNSNRKPINGSKILLVGLAYKPNVDDMRESPTFTLMDLLKKRGAEVAYHDPHIPVISPTREHAEWTGMKSVTWNKETISSYDLVLLATNHQAINNEEMLNWARCIVDTRNAFAHRSAASITSVWKA
jgi:UDP-N-acetyl-D-glucosamine dehydrogenase